VSCNSEDLVGSPDSVDQKSNRSAHAVVLHYVLVAAKAEIMGRRDLSLINKADESIADPIDFMQDLLEPKLEGLMYNDEEMLVVMVETLSYTQSNPVKPDASLRSDRRSLYRPTMTYGPSFIG
jgi:hypothetical protein